MYIAVNLKGLIACNDYGDNPVRRGMQTPPTRQIVLRSKQTSFLETVASKQFTAYSKLELSLAESRKERRIKKVNKRQDNFSHINSFIKGNRMHIFLTNIAKN